MSSAFITVEGPDGCGKTTFLRGLGDRLRQNGIPVVLTREPGGCSAAEQIRSLLVNGDVNRWRQLSEVLLHSAARNEYETGRANVRTPVTNAHIVYRLLLEKQKTT